MSPPVASSFPYADICAENMIDTDAEDQAKFEELQKQLLEAQSEGAEARSDLYEAQSKLVEAQSNMAAAQTKCVEARSKEAEAQNNLDEFMSSRIRDDTLPAKVQSIAESTTLIGGVPKQLVESRLVSPAGELPSLPVLLVVSKLLPGRLADSTLR